MIDPVFIDSDNALGSPFGDVDDAVMRPNTSMAWDSGTRRVNVCTALYRHSLWQRFKRLIAQECG